MTSRPGPSAGSRSRLRGDDVLLLGAAGVRARPLRAALSALGIAIGIAAMVAVVGLSASSQARLDEQLAALGTDLLTAVPAPAEAGLPAPPLPADAAQRVERIPGVTRAALVTDLPGVAVFRNRLIDPDRTGGLSVTAADLDLLDVVGASVRHGTWLNEATASLPTTVLGATAATRLGVTHPGAQVWLGGRLTTVVGILEPVVLAPELDVAALVGRPVASSLGSDGTGTRLYERSSEDSVAAVASLIAPTLQPERPGAVGVSRPSDALAARAASDAAFTGLLLGVGTIGLVIGGIGVANTMVVSVVERRREIALRRALGATRRHVAAQFLTEAVVLSALGGMTGAALGAAVTVVLAVGNGWLPVVPTYALAASMVLTVVIGGGAGLYPALRAARTAPSTALAG